MKAIIIFASACLGAIHSVAAAASPTTVCDLEGVTDIGALYAELSKRAVEAIRLASGTERDSAKKLGQLVDPSAPFSLGGGDVGRPLDPGPDGARAMAKLMAADSYRFDVWSSIPTPIENSCAKFEIEVEFIDSKNSESFPVKFAFENGRIVGASGWSHGFEMGPLTVVSK